MMTMLQLVQTMLMTMMKVAMRMSSMQQQLRQPDTFASIACRDEIFDSG